MSESGPSRERESLALRVSILLSVAFHVALGLALYHAPSWTRWLVDDLRQHELADPIRFRFVHPITPDETEVDGTPEARADRVATGARAVDSSGSSPERETGEPRVEVVESVARPRPPTATTADTGERGERSTGMSRMTYRQALRSHLDAHIDRPESVSIALARNSGTWILGEVDIVVGAGGALRIDSFRLYRYIDDPQRTLEAHFRFRLGDAVATSFRPLSEAGLSPPQRFSYKLLNPYARR